MKKIILNGVALIAMVLTMSSCLKDLDTLPLNPTDKTAPVAYTSLSDYQKGMSYIYGYFALVSQNDAGGSDLDLGFSGGESDLIRQYMILNEATTDALKCAWGDAYMSDLQRNLWTSVDNSAIITVYARCMKAVTLCNEYLMRASAETLAEQGLSNIEGDVNEFAAEVRFLRSLYYYILLDLYGNPPFATLENIGGEAPSQIGRDGLYNWIESELVELTTNSDMPDYGEVAYPRATKGAVWALLARMYLNAEVYTGTAQWEKAKNAAQEAIKIGYKLHDTPTGSHGLGAYSELFMQDNSTNGANEEFIFAVCYDNTNTQSWGGTTHLIAGSMSADAGAGIAKAMGLGDKTIYVEGWAGYHVNQNYVDYFELSNTTWGESGFGFDKANSDQRALLYNGDQAESFDITNFNSGWLCWKFSPLFSDGTAMTDVTSGDIKLSSTDFPLFRLAEMYLIYAEAQSRIDGGTTTDATALSYINKLRTRAGVSEKQVSFTTDYVLEERAREFMWEGQRRTDLIRYGKFTSASFAWPYKGGIENGAISIPEFRTVFPIIQSDISSNPNLVQNSGY